MIIFDELHKAQTLLKNGFSKGYDWTELFILAKYYRYIGEKNSSIKKLLLEFCETHMEEYNDVIYGGRLESAMKKSEKAQLRLPVEIFITEKEIAAIRSVNNYKYEKVLFTMLAMSRTLKLSGSGKSEQCWLMEKLSAILSKSKVYFNKQERGSLLYDLFSLGMIYLERDTKKNKSRGRENIRLLYADPNSPVAITISNMDNVIEYYKPICKNCGNEMEKKKRIDICDNCYKEKRKKDVLKNVKRFNEHH